LRRGCLWRILEKWGWVVENDEKGRGGTRAYMLAG
jgi:hypothetical protein